MADLTISFTLTPAIIATALVFDAALLMLGVLAVRRLRGTEPRARERSAPVRAHG